MTLSPEEEQQSPSMIQIQNEAETGDCSVRPMGHRRGGFCVVEIMGYRTNSAFVGQMSGQNNGVSEQ